MSRARVDAPRGGVDSDNAADQFNAPAPDTVTRPDSEERPSASDDLEAAADLVRPATLADLVLDAQAHSCVPNFAYCYLCEVQLAQRGVRRVSVRSTPSRIGWKG